MGDVMLFGIAKMPYEMAMRDEVSRRQFYSNAQLLVAALEAAREDGARLDWLDTQNLPVKMGWKCQTAPAGNVTITSVVFLGVAPTTIRQAIDQARGKGGQDVAVGR